MKGIVNMCIRKCFLNFGEKIFNILVIIGFVAGAASAITSGMDIGGRGGLISGILQLVLSWSGTLIISLIVYSLLDIRHHVSNSCSDKEKTDKGGCN